MEVGEASTLYRDPLAIKGFVASTLTGLFAWSGTITKKDEQAGTTRVRDPGVAVRGTNGRAGKVTTTSWEAAHGLSEGFRQSFLAQLADMTPKNVFTGQVQSVLDLKYISEPEIVSSGRWKLRLMTNWVLYERGSDRIGKALPFNKEITVIAVNVNFIPTGKVVKKVWLDDPSRIVIDADGSLCIQSDGSGCTDGGASVIHLRRINKIHFPHLPQTPTTLLSVVTENPQGQRRLYQFRVTYGTGAPKETTISVNPDIHRPTPGSTEGILVRLTRIQRGLERAEQTGMIHPSYGNQVISARVRTFLAWGKSGVPLEQAAARTGLPLSLLVELEALGRTFDSLPPDAIRFTSTPSQKNLTGNDSSFDIPWLSN